MFRGNDHCCRLKDGSINLFNKLISCVVFQPKPNLDLSPVAYQSIELSGDNFPLVAERFGTMGVFDLFSYKYAAVGGAALVSYLIAGAIYRLYFSPVSKFPGPKLAALTLWYVYLALGIYIQENCRRPTS
jgi:hypothetical protein